MKKTFLFFVSIIQLCWLTGLGQSQPQPWHNQARTIHYRPDGEDFVTTNGKRRFNRALYGTNTAFRAEAGDLPEFAMYLPGIGGTLRLGLVAGEKSKWLIEAESITARYRPGSMLYEIRDPLLGTGTLHLTVLAMHDAEGMLIQANYSGKLAANVSLVYAFGGVTGKKLSRDGDIGADPESSFYLKPENCTTNQIKLNQSAFQLTYGADNQRKTLIGLLPNNALLHVADASQQQSPSAFLAAQPSATPALAGQLPLTPNRPLLAAFQVPGTRQHLMQDQLPALFTQAEQARKTLADRVKLTTPDPYINTLGGALSVAADAIWENPTYMHGAVAWRMRLNGWRGPYAGDPLGWHDRSRAHFRAYAKSQLTSPDIGLNVPDTLLHFARQQEKLGNAVFSSGYICRNPNGDFRPHHYDMNLVYIDELLWHINWTGDLDFVREIWPVLTRHLAWEKRNFDANNDGLYDAYCCIWASDALQYSGGGVTHSSAYNYRANKLVARLAALIGENPEPYRREADTILQALNQQLWLPTKGWYAEYKDLLGLQQLHPSAGLWTVYHAIDSEVPDAFRAYQTMRYVDTEIPHIPIRAAGLPDTDLYTISTTNWMPYDWSLNNVALPELMHTSLAYWQAGRANEAFRLWKSSLVESMYIGISPGNFQQLSFYDANRSELYRDFADPIGVTARTVVEGLFGIVPNALDNQLTIRPGFPDAWNEAALTIPDVTFSFQRKNTVTSDAQIRHTDTYVINPTFGKPMRLRLQVKALTDQVKQVTVNGKPTKWRNLPDAVGQPMLEVEADAADNYQITIEWAGKPVDQAALKPQYGKGATLTTTFAQASVVHVFDPQKTLAQVKTTTNAVRAQVVGETGNRTAFVQLRQGAFTWWEPLTFAVNEPITVVSTTADPSTDLRFRLDNHTDAPIQGKVTVNTGSNAFVTTIRVNARSRSAEVVVPAAQVIFGTNPIMFTDDKGHTVRHELVNWTSPNRPVKTETVSLTSHFNDQVTNIFRNKYLSPRPTSPTLQLPEQGIGNWCYPLTEANIDDAGLRALAGSKNDISLPSGIPFRTTGAAGQPNILFVSQWDNYPNEATVPLTGRASHAYFLMAGSSNPMQSQFVNGELVVTYTDGTVETLSLRNPDTWWPIEQDYYADGYAFRLTKPVPYRVHLKTGLITRHFDRYTSIKGFTGRAIDGGAATVLDMPLNPAKTLKGLRLNAQANDVVIGLMSVTLVRE